MTVHCLKLEIRNLGDLSACGRVAWTNLFVRAYKNSFSASSAVNGMCRIFDGSVMDMEIEGVLAHG